MKAIWNGTILAESNETIEIEGNQYFPARFDQQRIFQTKRDAHGLRLERHGELLRCRRRRRNNKDAAWFYPEAKDDAKEIENYVAFWKGVEIIK